MFKVVDVVVAGAGLCKGRGRLEMIGLVPAKIDWHKRDQGRYDPNDYNGTDCNTARHELIVKQTILYVNEPIQANCAQVQY